MKGGGGTKVLVRSGREPDPVRPASPNPYVCDGTLAVGEGGFRFSWYLLILSLLNYSTHADGKERAPPPFCSLHPGFCTECVPVFLRMRARSPV